MSFLSDMVKRLTSRTGSRSESKRERRVEDTLARCQEALGFTFTRKELLKQALTHRSAISGENAGRNSLDSNERLEFLGDSVLGLVVNEHLFHQYPKRREGLLTQMKSLLVSRAILSVKAKEMRMGEFLFLSPGEEESGGRDRSSILADSFEAITGAIYLDKGMDAARAFIEKRLMADSRRILEDRNHINYKSMLQEYIQSEKKIHPQYKVTSEAGPDHEKIFTVDVTVGKKALGRGRGKNKKQAQQEAARAALNALDLLPKRTDGNGSIEENFGAPKTGGRNRAGDSSSTRRRGRGRRRK